MIDFIKQVIITTAALVLAQYIHSFLFCIFRANKYEDDLAAKIAKKIKEHEGWVKNESV